MNNALIIAIVLVGFILLLVLATKPNNKPRKHIDVTGIMQAPKMSNLNDDEYSSLNSILSDYIKNVDPEQILVGKTSELLNSYLWALKKYCTLFSRHLRVCCADNHSYIDLYGENEHFCPDSVRSIICTPNSQPDLEIRNSGDEFISSAPHRLMDLTDMRFQNTSPKDISEDYILPISCSSGVLRIIDPELRGLAEEFLLRVQTLPAHLIDSKTMNHRLRLMEKRFNTKTIRDGAYAIIDVPRDFFLSRGISVLSDEDSSRSKICLSITDDEFERLLARLDAD